MTTQPEHVQAPGLIPGHRASRRLQQGLGGRDPSGGGARIKSIPHITGVDVLHSTATVREGKTVEYHVDLKVGYVVEPGWIDLYMQTT